MYIDNDMCFECGSTVNIQNHHIIPKSKGGVKTIPLCQKCHSKIHGEKMLHIQKLAKEAKKLKYEEAKIQSAKTGQSLSELGFGRPKGTIEDLNSFINKPKNIEIAKLLVLGYTHRKIAKKLKVSSKTIGKVNKVIKANREIKT